MALNYKYSVMKFVVSRHSEGSVQVRELWQQVLLLQGDI